MNMSLINEMRAHSIKVQIAITAIERERTLRNNETLGTPEYAALLLAKSNCLNGIAVLVAANKK